MKRCFAKKKKDENDFFLSREIRMSEKINAQQTMLRGKVEMFNK